MTDDGPIHPKVTPEELLEEIDRVFDAAPSESEQKELAAIPIDDLSQIEMFVFRTALRRCFER